MSVSFHPEFPAVIAGGTFCGEVRVWNTGLTGDPLVACSGLSDLGHKEPVAKVFVYIVCMSGTQHIGTSHFVHYTIIMEVVLFVEF